MRKEYIKIQKYLIYFELVILFNEINMFMRKEFYNVGL